MRAIVYSHTGDPDVLRLVERKVPATAAGQVRVRVHISGVNPTDWKSRRGSDYGTARGGGERWPLAPLAVPLSGLTLMLD